MTSGDSSFIGLDCWLRRVNDELNTILLIKSYKEVVINNYILTSVNSIRKKKIFRGKKEEYKTEEEKFSLE